MRLRLAASLRIVVTSDVLASVSVTLGLGKPNPRACRVCV